MPAAIKVTNLAEVNATVGTWFKAVEKAAAEAAVGMARTAFEDLLETSPQYSGDFVANWVVSKNVPSTAFYEGVFSKSTKPLFQMGSTPAMSYARANAEWPKLKLGETLFISNSAAHTEPYAMKIEKGEIKLRPINEDGHHVVQRAVRMLGHHYSVVGPVQLDILRKLGS